ncbi:MAG: isoprenyl transferase [Eggerthellaceae bacterium]|nr:isoprenyl transferase [Eggerthellaceae bacterium]
MTNKPLTYIFPDPPAGLDPALLDLSAVPNHVAVIMDGNGRWATARGQARMAGHKAGVEAVRETIRCASDLGVRYLTLYSFSSENWRRPLEEVSALMALFAKTMLAEVEELHKENVRVRFIGDLSRLPEETRSAFDKAQAMTKDNTGLTLVLAVNYGARDDIVSAARKYAQTCVDASKENKELPLLDKDIFFEYLATSDIPDPDLMIRTSGEMRLSNFLLWEIAYTEFYVTDVLWPDFDRYCFLRALLEYQARSRRFGGIG